MTTKTHNRMIDGAAVNVLDFGADPTGAVDSTQAIQTAIDAGGEYCSIFFPKGTYRLLGQLVISNIGVKLAGEGRFITIIKTEYDGANLGCIKVRHSQCNIQDMTVSGTSDITEKGYDTTQRALHLVADLNSNNIDCWVSNVSFEYFNVCVHQEGRNVNLDNCLFSNSHHGILMSNVIDARGLNVSSSCRFHSMTKTGEAGACIWCPGDADFADLTVNKPYSDDCYRFFYGFASGTSMSVHSDRARGRLLEITDTGHGVTSSRRNFDIVNTFHSQWYNLTSPETGIIVGGGQYDLLISNVHIAQTSGHGVQLSKSYAMIDGLRIDDVGQASDNTYDGLHITSSAGSFTVGDVRIAEGLTGGTTNYMRNAIRMLAGGTFTSKSNLVNIKNGNAVYLEPGNRIFGEYPREYYPRVDWYSSDPLTELAGQTVGTGDVLYRLGGGVTAEAGHQVTASGIIGSTAVLTKFGIRY